MLSVLLNPNSIATDKKTGNPVELAKERAHSVVLELEKARRRLILPAPACAELLTAIGPTAQQYLNLIGRSRFVEVAGFDANCASELAILNRDTFRASDERDKLEPYQKVKVDRQIIAICRVKRVTELYTDDDAPGRRARLCGIVPIPISEIPIPENHKQMPLGLEPQSETVGSDPDERS